ncbi:5-formyltetrahydrofolate cyclo-ligase [Maribacter sp. 2307UL18-2]|uniref:5-formyltetrahydrofolate cyclo-ligase n=1 Tax=Maribacter sp. 2307UL18-2 TaxID=3386274 RepID=UPI0039BD50D8
MLKKDARLKYSQLRKKISKESLLNSSLAIANKTLELPIWKAEYFHIFLPIPEKNELDTTFILSILQGKDKTIVLPKVSGKNQLKNYVLTDSTKLKLSEWGIPEPVDGIELPEDKIDVVFVPLLAFDKKGNRVGYGKGFYDVFLQKCKSDVIKVGLSIFEAEEWITDTNDHDVPLDYGVTPKTTYSFATA